jgi:hypothetical protein
MMTAMTALVINKRPRALRADRRDAADLRDDQAV